MTATSILEKTELIKELQNILTQLSIDLKYGRGYFDGGLFRYKEKSVIYLNRAHTVDQHIDIIARELKQFDLGKIKLNPDIREYLTRPEEN